MTTPVQFSSPLSGKEMLRAFGSSPSGRPCGEDFLLTTAQIAALAGTNQPSVTGITAGTTRTQAGATVLVAGISRVDTSTAPSAGSILGDGVVLPVATSGDVAIIINNTGNRIQVYGNGSDTINGVAGSTGISIPPNSQDFYVASATGGWTVETGTGYSGQLMTELSLVGITAGTTRTQAGATALVAEINRVDTSTAVTAGTTLGDGVKLQAAVPGLDIVVVNNTANIIQVYGNGSDTVNGVAGATGIPIPPNGVYIFVAVAAGSWQVESGVGGGSSGSIPTQVVQEAITASTTISQAAATAITSSYAHVKTGGAGYAVALPAWADGAVVTIYNDTVYNISVYTQNGGTAVINNNSSSATPITQMPGSISTYAAFLSGATQGWNTISAGTGYAIGTSLVTENFQTGVSAAGTTQGTATQLTAQIANVTTVTAGSGVNLPGAVVSTTTQSAGLQVFVENNGANPLSVYPAQGATSDTINGNASTVPTLINPGTTATFTSVASGVWTVQAASTQTAASTTFATAATVVLTAAVLTGGTASVDLTLTGATTITSLTTDTAANIVKALHTPTIGTSYRLRIINVVGVATSALTGGSGVTVSSPGSGVVTIPSSGWREFVVTVTAIGTPALTMKSVATGTWS